MPLNAGNIVFLIDSLFFNLVGGYLKNVYDS